MSTKILIVDDSTTDRLIISTMLADYHTLTACDGLDAMALIEKNPDIDLVILDLNMPRMNGFEVLEAMQENPEFRKIRTIILTNYDEIDNEVKGLELGAVDYIRKPLNIQSLLIRINIHIKLKQVQKMIEQDNERLDAMVLKKTREVAATRDITIQALVGLLEVRNVESSRHTIRTQLIMKILCDHLKTKDKYKDILTEAYVKELVTTTPLHDIGKVGIPDNILLKPGRLTDDEFTIMKKHVNYGVNALQNEIYCDEDVPSFIKTAMEIVGAHHEKYDGTGYPNGLLGGAIPLPGRLMAIIDVYDALTSKRIYKPAYDFDYSIDLIISESGKHFDPDIVVGFLEIKEQVAEISRKFIQEIHEVETL
ncbi:HD domain-containing phosphohydrolase [Acetobacterium carbinolicum]|jgi:putative two-component system response regulator|uniref:HD domain-containing phosphohydrolase n=1 Tax=Acetobacterium TaxID=33951 RepID=UPI000DBEBEE4|nr:MULTISPECIES: HD domain-containing phosphohydrolase [unclassified Acetobacterium]AWW27571.1 two-component system response regulator [Acetobacterium sp. KB-1]MDZ5724095.1 response regulator [Acetobacterium sp. K1/6]